MDIPKKTYQIAGKNLELPVGARVVILGANGSGKSTIGCALAGAGNSERIAARRALEIPDTISLQTLNEAEQGYRSARDNQKTVRTVYQNDFNQALINLMAEATEHAVQLTERLKAGEAVNPKDARDRKDEVIELWESLFPKRKLTFKKHQPKVEIDGGGSYGQNQMSDGERQALYAIVKLALTPDNVDTFIIDEPEIHLHSALARKLWDSLEEQHKSRTFFYITHDITFAISRRTAQILLLKGQNDFVMLNSPREISDDVARHLVGAATTAISTQKVVFCEGMEGSPDVALFRAWFNPSEVEVIPVGSCGKVLNCMRAAKENGLLKGAEFLGIIDKDDRCEEELEYFSKQGAHILPVFEIEHLLILPEVVRVVFEVTGKSKTEADEAITKAKDEAVGNIKPNLHKHSIGYAKQKLRWLISDPSQEVETGSGSEDAKAAFKTSFDNKIGRINPEEIYKTSEEKLNEALAKDFETLLAHFSHKNFYSRIASMLNLTGAEYLEVVTETLKGKNGGTHGTNMRKALAAHLPN